MPAIEFHTFILQHVLIFIELNTIARLYTHTASLSFKVTR